ncbi:precorrin-4 C(11)-methyltransferase [Prevotella sp. DNF00663]|uniref:precorrin-4 C(11)-methyltransferase n=1 Tax=unclassified Prevotella TaxID=2638335 RepID=UPI000512AC3A|nr:MULTISPECIES: precorrin-4 C(11)-methyltransferase [unclassified Prevotella]KGI59717.1 cobalamin biosynthesis protein CbiG [Prevotella sp. S7 MS 2]KXB81454.1 precorrin-4 C(11)-methyltransferase [Prevotella sp. DNF00663]
MKIAIIPISAQGRAIADKLKVELQGEIIVRESVGRVFHDFDAFVFIGAMGICVRTIAPFVEDKHTDPAVICIDSMGNNVISVLSGHVGGANKLTHEIAGMLGTMPVVTTQSDYEGLWPLDTLARQFGWTASKTELNDCIFAFTNHKPTALLLEVKDRGTEYLERTCPDFVDIYYCSEDIDTSRYALILSVSYRQQPVVTDNLTLNYIPRCVHVGLGLAHQAQPTEQILDEIWSALLRHNVSHDAIIDLNTIDVKADEPVVAVLEETYPFHFYTAEELQKIDVPNGSKVVAKHVGTPSVSEASALLAASGGQLVVEKQKGEKWTLAVAVDVAFQRGAHIEFVGAGPGDPDLISVRGRNLLETADLILYAGSLVPKAVVSCAKAGATVRSSADLDLEEQVELMQNFYQKGKQIVRLHTGDPCLYGAIQEQMALLDKAHMNYHITPGISAFQAAAAELRSQFTIPQKTQTIILTRGEGRTPMPEKEKLHMLAHSQSTMCIYLSATLVDEVQKELLMEYPAETPVAACYRLTWPEQKIFRGQLKDLAKIVKDNRLTLDTLLVVGEAIGNRSGLSELYSSHFTHLFRNAKS